LISLRQTATELERLEALNSSTAAAYKMAIRSVAQYTVELDAGEAAAFRVRLLSLAELYDAAAAADDVGRVQSSFRGELREYRDQTKLRIERLRKEVEAGAAAMAAFAGTIASNSADHGAQMRGELEHLRKVREWSDLGEIRRGIDGVIQGIGETLQQMERANQMAILQLKDEIRMLHQDLESRRRAAITDSATGAWNRNKSEERLQELLRQSEPFVLLLVSVTNLCRLRGRFPQRVVDGVLNAMVKRLRGIAGDDAPVGRWSERDFIALLDADPAQAMALSREISANLSSTYSVQDAGVARTISIEVATGTVERPAGFESEAFLKRVNQLSATLGGE